MQESNARKFTGIESIGAIVERVALDAVIQSPIVAEPGDTPRDRLKKARGFDYQCGRALWRAERVSRRKSKDARQSVSWVMACRRRIASEIIRWARSQGAGPALANQMAERAALRFPRDGIIREGKTPRERRLNARAVGRSPRQQGLNPRALGTSPRQRRQESNNQTGIQTEIQSGAM